MKYLDKNFILVINIPVTRACTAKLFRDIQKVLDTDRACALMATSSGTRGPRCISLVLGVSSIATGELDMSRATR